MEDYIFDTIEYKGFKINIKPDHCPENPRESWDQLGTLAYYSYDSVLGDKDHDHSGREPMLLNIAELSYEQEEWIENQDYKTFDYETYFLNQIAKHSIFVDDHDRFCYVSKDAVKKEHKCKIITKKVKDLVLRNLQGELDVQQQWGDNEVYGYEIEGIDYEIDSCWGFYGDNWEKNGLTDHAYPAIDYHIAQETEKADKQKKSHFAHIKSYIKNKVALIYRDSYIPYAI